MLALIVVVIAVAGLASWYLEWYRDRGHAFEVPTLNYIYSWRGEVVSEQEFDRRLAWMRNAGLMPPAQGSREDGWL